VASGNKFYCFVEDVAEGKHNLGSDTFKIFLTNTLPAATATVIGDISEISYTNLSSRDATATTSAQTSGAYKLVLPDVTLTASGAVGPFQYVGIYNDTSDTDALIAWYDHGTSISMIDTETYKCDFNQVDGFITLI